ncbi:hypothetical protein Q4508_18680 [Amphritea sp. 2_MG-2023]|jgi:hypothetical protein|uniref:hypothetical protein n=1 Tax=Amphritea TaxID=515417 RepID=UPI001C072393|nr:MULTISPECIES: hypothetical protein [Amphritea]MBU2967026.1 hypothetical protein [Amphritea atlantica]MDO6420585.1 hypothetical protein [Amphritea sp. 2_MG-2023]MDX2422876.1 hypothetical protein [Amphritea sp.]
MKIDKSVTLEDCLTDLTCEQLDNILARIPDLGKQKQRKREEYLSRKLARSGVAVDMPKAGSVLTEAAILGYDFGGLVEDMARYQKNKR